jgi:predicted nucleotidyltransferase
LHQDFHAYKLVSVNIPEDTMAVWAKGPSQTETDKCENAERAIRKAFDADEEMKRLNVSIFATGSYRVRTNVKLDSDVDICVRYNGAIFPEYPEGTTAQDLDLVDSPLSYADFKNKVEHALQEHFGAGEVKRGNKAFKVNENSYRIVAEVVATFERRIYTKHADGSYTYRAGVGFNTDSGKFIQNFPQQTYDNGVARNDATSRSYKRVIRILKRMRNKMQEDNIPEAKNVASFLIESLVWNAPVTSFEHSTWTGILRSVLANVCDDTRDSVDCSKWTEVNDIKYLFHATQPWTKKQANQFLNAAWTYMGYT